MWTEKGPIWRAENERPQSKKADDILSQVAKKTTPTTGDLIDGEIYLKYS